MDDRIGVNPITMGEVVDFQDCVNTCEWIELPKQGSRYTWNDRHGDQRIFFKIDWVFVNRDWMDQMLAYNTIILPEGMSDHCPISVKLTNAPMLRRRPFKLCNNWAQHPQFLTKEVVHTEAANIARIFVEYYQELLGKKTQGRLRAFRSFLINGPTLSVEQQLQLVQPYEAKDVKDALFSIDKNKSPGPDGYGSEFFEASWGIIGAEITKAMLKFFNNGQLLKQINSTMIALIPKVEVPQYARKEVWASNES
ncbi:uncharacterized protein LOC142173857 [Nicotiana tabacum]|uniref:Uncharacterized protein LOC142173857 n=1 Tax=Nicotiana tabacum TaxID=4097 RepID=A0AC58TF28_TOBAC